MISLVTKGMIGAGSTRVIYASDVDVDPDSTLPETPDAQDQDITADGSSVDIAASGSISITPDTDPVTL